MYRLRIASVVLLLLLMAALALYAAELTAMIAASEPFSWMFSYIAPRLVFLLLSVGWLTVFLSLISLNTKAKTGIGVLCIGAAIGGFLIMNPPYIADWQKYGQDLTGIYNDNDVEHALQTSEPDFDGLVMLALPNCPYCFMAYPQLERLKHRDHELDVAVFVSAKDSFGVHFFEEKIGKSEIPVYLLSDRDQATELSNGKFPTFLYLKDGKLIHRWSSDQFGYPALDWIEDRLN